MATAKKAAPAATEGKAKREKKVRGPKETFADLSVLGTKQNITQSVSHIRSVGCFVTTTVNDAKGNPISSTTNFVGGIKPKKKGDERFLVIDKGPKPKKEKKATAEKAKK